MTLDLLSLVVFVAAVAAGASLLVRRLPRADAAATGEPVCLSCRTPARRLPADSFVCPGCGTDVRFAGLAPARSAGFAGPFWRVVTFSALLCTAALLTTALATIPLPRFSYVSEESSQWRSGQEYRVVEFSAAGRRSMGSVPRTLHGEVRGDLFLKSGELYTLEVHGPELRYRILDTAGRTITPLSAPGAFDRSAVVNWLTAAGLEPGDEDFGLTAGAAYARFHRMLGLPGAAPEERWPGDSGGGSSGASGSAGVPEYVLPSALMFWSLAWLAGVWLILRRPGASPPVAQIETGVSKG